MTSMTHMTLKLLPQTPSVDVHICAIHNPCRHEAECRRQGLEYECQCARGYVGDYCQGFYC